MEEYDVFIESEYQIAATLSFPSNEEEKYPVVIMVHGSGPVDRDENAKRLKINAFKELSELATEVGYASLRYDKRGIGKSKGDYFETGFFDLVDDAVKVVEFAKKHPNINENKIYLLGHSEGCLVSPIVHLRLPVQGMILLAPSAEPLGDTTAWQREQMKDDMRTMKGFQGWLLRAINADKKLEKMNEKMSDKIRGTDAKTIRYKGQKINAKWNREHENVDVREYLQDIDCPVLAITGSKDVQVKSEDLKVISALVQGECDTYIIEDMTHILRKTSVDYRISNILKDYKNQVKKTLDQELRNLIADWLRKQ
ncbi:MAG: alpha/beta hydrolase [Anaerobacillus sp.]